MPSDAAIQVAIVDDHPITSEALAARFIGAGFSVLAPSPDVESVNEHLKPDVVVCDLHLPGLSGGRAVAYLVDRGFRVLATSGAATSEEVLDAIASGARGFVEKSASPHTFIPAVRAVAADGHHISVRLAGYLLEDGRRRPLGRHEIGAPAVSLLRALAQGDLIQDIAADDGISADDVRNLLDSVFDAARRRRRLLRPARRELEVMVLVGCQGMTHQAAARHMGVQKSVVADYLKKVKEKYLASHPDAGADIAPKTAAALWAHELGLT
jgi:DNA-binding NarL/FixJ family response regulator